MGAIGRELVRLAQERVIALDRAVDQYREGDPLRHELGKKLAEARTDLALKIRLLRGEESGFGS